MSRQEKIKEILEKISEIISSNPIENHAPILSFLDKDTCITATYPSSGYNIQLVVEILSRHKNNTTTYNVFIYIPSMENKPKEALKFAQFYWMLSHVTITIESKMEILCRELNQEKR